MRRTSVVGFVTGEHYVGHDRRWLGRVALEWGKDTVSSYAVVLGEGVQP